MKIQCDVCDKEEASVFCVADEAALCAPCDHRVHHANKLAGKHERFSLHHPSAKQVPLCDICKEKRAYLFCQQDRAILCKDCDNSIHKVNEHTQKHTRFILTGVSLSSIAAVYSDSPSASASSISKAAPCTAKATTTSGVTQATSCAKSNVELMPTTTTTSSISEYLIETLPGWHVEDFLDCSSPSPYIGYCKNGEMDGLSIWDANLDSSNMIGSFPEETTGLWVPQVPPPPPFHHNQTGPIQMNFGSTYDGLIIKEQQSKQFGISNNNNMKLSRKWNEDNSFAVPQISSPSSNATFKRSRTLW